MTALSNETVARLAHDTVNAAERECQEQRLLYGFGSGKAKDVLDKHIASTIEGLVRERDFWEQRSLENTMLAHQWMTRHDRNAAGIDGGPFPSPVDLPNAIARAEAAESELAKTREALERAVERIEYYQGCVDVECACEPCPECGKMPEACSGTECASACQCSNCDHCQNAATITSARTFLARAADGS